MLRPTLPPGTGSDPSRMVYIGPVCDFDDGDHTLVIIDAIPDSVVPAARRPVALKRRLQRLQARHWRVVMHGDGTRETIPAMTNPETIERVRELRQRGRTPKEIARALGLPPAAVAPLIRAVAAAQPTRETALVGCWVNQGWAAGLTVTGHPEWPGAGATAESGESGLVNILVAREIGGRVSACGYLVDAWCLGVKNALGPKWVDRRKLPGFRDWYFRSYDQPPLAAPIDLARHLVFGAVEYARASRPRTAPGLRRVRGSSRPRGRSQRYHLRARRQADVHPGTLR